MNNHDKEGVLDNWIHGFLNDQKQCLGLILLKNFCMFLKMSPWFLFSFYFLKIPCAAKYSSFTYVIESTDYLDYFRTGSKISLMVCPSVGPNCFSHVQIRHFWTNFHNFYLSKMIGIQPKSFRQSKIILDPSKSFWTHRRTRHYIIESIDYLLILFEDMIKNM